MEMIISPERGTGRTRVLRYDAHGYALLVDGHVEMSRRLEAICYLFDAENRERIALIHGLQDAGEFLLARVVATTVRDHSST